MMPQASDTLFDRLVARLSRPEQASAVASSPSGSDGVELGEEIVRRGPGRREAPASGAATSMADQRRAATETAVDRRASRPAHAEARNRPATRAVSLDVAIAPPAAIEGRGRPQLAADLASSPADDASRSTAVRAPVVTGRPAGARPGTVDAAAPATAVSPPLQPRRSGPAAPPVPDWRPSALVPARSSEAAFGTTVPAAAHDASTRRDAAMRERSAVVRPDLPTAIPPRPRPAQTSAPAPEATIHVTIGRLDIRPGRHDEPTGRGPAPAAHDGGAAALHSYLAARGGAS